MTVTLARYKVQRPGRNNVAHIIEEGLPLCRNVSAALAQLPTDHKTTMCQNCLRVKDKHDLGRDDPEMAREHRIRRTLLGGAP